MSKETKKPVTLTLKQKLEVIKASESGQSSRKLAAHFFVGKTQINNILKRKAKLLELEKNNSPMGKKRCIGPTANEDINELTYTWFCDAARRNIEVNGSRLQKKALEFATELNKTTFKASNGWKESFLKRYNIVLGKLSCDSGDASVKVVNDWKERLVSVIEGHNERDIYVMDETGLYYKTTQDRSFYKRWEKPEGIKKAKERITMSLCANMAGEKEPVLFIGRAAKPRAFKSIGPDTLPVTYRHSKNAWMNKSLFSSWLQSFNQKMKNQGRKVLLFLDNAPSHAKENLSNVTLCFLPAKTTSVLQPLNQGIIQALKLKYRKQQYRHIVLEMRKDDRKVPEIMTKVDILQAILWTAEAWKQVDPVTIRKCLAKTGFTSRDQEGSFDSTPEADDGPTPEEFDALSMQMTGVPFDCLASIDEDIKTEDTIDRRRSKLNIQQRTREADQEQDTDDNSDLEEEQSPEPTTVTQALDALSTLKSFFIEKSRVDSLTAVQNLDKAIFDCVTKT